VNEDIANDDATTALADPHVQTTNPPGDELGGGLGNAEGDEPASDG
jgi:hypothetical protein